MPPPGGGHGNPLWSIPSGRGSRGPGVWPTGTHRMSSGGNDAQERVSSFRSSEMRLTGPSLTGPRVCVPLGWLLF